MVALKAFPYSIQNVHEVEGQVEETEEFYTQRSTKGTIPYLPQHPGISATKSPTSYIKVFVSKETTDIYGI